MGQKVKKKGIEKFEKGKYWSVEKSVRRSRLVRVSTSIKKQQQHTQRDQAASSSEKSKRW